jgi:small subunit ribosomal protein S20
LANHPSALKRARQREKREERNRARRTAARSKVREVLAAVASGDAKAARSALAEARRVLDRAAARGALPKERVARKISRLTIAVAKLS